MNIPIRDGDAAIRKARFIAALLDTRFNAEGPTRLPKQSQYYWTAERGGANAFLFEQYPDHVTRVRRIARTMSDASLFEWGATVAASKRALP